MLNIKCLSVCKHIMVYKLLSDLVLKQENVYFKMVVYSFEPGGFPKNLRKNTLVFKANLERVA